MKNRSAMRKAILIAGSSMLIAIYSIGCQCDDKQQKQPMGEFFPAQGETRDYARAQNVQIASGARADATLQTYHFDKGELNSLGKQKLSNMLDDDDANNPMTVYLNIAETDEFKAAKQSAIVAYLKEQGLEEKQVAFKLGANPAAGHPAVDGLARLSKTESGGAGGGAGGGGGSGGGDPGTAGYGASGGMTSK